MTTTHAPSEAAIQATMQEFAAAARARDTTALVACFAEDAVLEGVGGTYRGKAAIARAFDWLWEMLPTSEYRDVGMGLRVVDSIAVWESMMTAVNADGARLEVLNLETYEFDDDAKINHPVCAGGQPVATAAAGGRPDDRAQGDAVPLVREQCRR